MCDCVEIPSECIVFVYFKGEFGVCLEFEIPFYLTVLTRVGNISGPFVIGGFFHQCFDIFCMSFCCVDDMFS